MSRKPAIFSLLLFVLISAPRGGAQQQTSAEQPAPAEVQQAVPTEQQAAQMAAASADRVAPRSGAQFDTRVPLYRLTPSDVFDLHFTFSPEYDQTITIQPDGYVALKGVGDLHLAGKTKPEAIAEIKAAYASFLHDPEITIVLKEFDKPHFFIFGQLNTPGKYDLRSDTTVTEAIAMAGGFNEAAKHSQVLLFRQVSNGWTEVKALNIKKMLKDRDLSEDIHLRAGDMLFVPQNAYSKLKRYIPTPGVGVYYNPAGL